jgi:polysaccharide biosynthesis protein PslG
VRPRVLFAFLVLLANLAGGVAQARTLDPTSRPPWSAAIAWVRSSSGLPTHLTVHISTSRPAHVQFTVVVRSCADTVAQSFAADAVLRPIHTETHVSLRLNAGLRRALLYTGAIVDLKANIRAVGFPRVARRLHLRLRSAGTSARTNEAHAACADGVVTPPVNQYAGRVGIGAHMLRNGETDVAQQLHRLHAGGIDWVREDFSWAQIEPERGVFDWASSDRYMAAAATAGVSVLAIADYSAPWASSDPSGNGDQDYPPSNDQDFANYTQALAERYGTNGTFWHLNPNLPARPLAAIELWNEPYGYWFWKPGPDPAAYAKLVEAASAAVRAVDPNIKLLASGDLVAVYGNDSRTQWRDWLTALLDADPRIVYAIDAWSVHPYPSPWNLGPYGKSWSPRLSFSRVEQIHSILVARSADKPIWITEIGWTTATGVQGAVSEQTQARYLVSAVKRAINEWGSFVPRIFVFSWDKASGIPTDRDTNNGLRRADDSSTPAWYALAKLLTSPTSQAPRGSPPSFEPN